MGENPKGWPPGYWYVSPTGGAMRDGATIAAGFLQEESARLAAWEHYRGTREYELDRQVHVDRKAYDTMTRLFQEEKDKVSDLKRRLNTAEQRFEDQLREAHHVACTCGGAGPGEGCPACEMAHWFSP